LEPRGVPPAPEDRRAEALDDGPAARARRYRVARALARGRILPRHLQGVGGEGRGLGLRRVPVHTRRPVPVLCPLGRPARATRGLGRCVPRRGRQSAGLPSPAHARRADAARARMGADRPEGRGGHGTRDPGTPRGARGPGDARRGRRSHARETALDPGPRFRAARRGQEQMSATTAGRARGLPHEARAAALLLAPGLAAILVLFIVPIIAAFFLSLTDFDIYSLG